MRLSLLLVVLCCLAACSSREAPAPVTSLNDIRNYYKKYPQGEANARYTVQAGDTLYSIAFRSGLDYRELAAQNNIPVPYRIYPGQVLHLVNAKTAAIRGETQKITAGTQNPGLNGSNLSNISPVKPLSANKAVAPQNQTGYVRTQTVKENATAASSPIASSKIVWNWPVRGPILATFSNAEHGNKGLDIGGAAGTPVRAAAAGEVVYAGNALRGYGNLVIIRHNDDYLSAYAHNRRLLVKERDTVVSGQKIAEMGNTDATSTRLHFEIRFRGKSVDPKKYLK
ncbi:peptidoglycan DD-metalloendopeptidase family protein [Rheinheimera sp.]|uniref:peptidoglycan DD-metalloendopeptidase family protein n=1 Tax=Rheinheimera sp. TaxID=1869214 RepID=UPI00307E3F85